MSDTKTIHDRHPDLFTAEEALKYLHKMGTEPHLLETLKREHGLRGVCIGREMLYHRRHLDSLIVRLFGLDVEAENAAKVAGSHGAGLKLPRRTA